MYKFYVMYQNAFSSKLTKLFLGFLLIIFLKIAAQGSQTNSTVSQQDLLVTLDVLIDKAETDLAEAAKLKTIEGRIAITGLSTEGTEVSPEEINYLLKKMERMTASISEFYFIRSTEGINKEKVSKENNLERTSGSVAEMQGYAKDLSTPFFTSLKLAKEGETLYLFLTIYNTETAKIVWKNTWFTQYRTKQQSPIDEEQPQEKKSKPTKTISELGAILFVDDYYFFGASISIGGDIDDTVILSLNVTSLISIGGETNTSVTVDNVDYDNVRASVFGLAFPLSIVMSVSLINSHQRNFKAFDLEFHLETGIVLAALTLSGRVKSRSWYYSYSVPFDVEVFAYRPIILLGFNFLFEEQYSLRIGADFGLTPPMLSNLRRPTTYVIPYISFGYRF